VTVETNIFQMKHNPLAMILGHREDFKVSEIISGEMKDNPIHQIEILLRKQIIKNPSKAGFPIQIIQLKKDDVINPPKIYS
jgi:hypothetical protein